MDTQKMAPVISVTANEEISVNNEHGSNKINPMALKMKENYQTNISTAAKLTLAITPVTTNNLLENNQEQLHIDCEDIYSIKGRFAWESIEKYKVPYIIRVINGVKLKFVSIRMAEVQLLNNYLSYLHADIFICKSVKSHFITDNEAKLLNEINYHTDFAFGNEMFSVEKEFIVLLEDVHELYKFIEVCLIALLSNFHTGCQQKCGFIRINSESVVPYCIKNSQKYVPLFYFEGETEKLQHLAIKLENWNLAYLKFCCKVQGISYEYFNDESWTVISLDDIKKSYSTETNFEEYWPPQNVVLRLLTNQKSIHINPTGAWIRAPSKVVLAKNTIPHTLTASAPEILQSLLMATDTSRNEWPENQMVHSYSFQAQSPSTITTLDNSIVTRNQSIAAQCYNADSTVSQGSSLINGVGHVGRTPPPPLIRACNTAPAIGNSVSYSNAAPSSQCVMTMYNSMTNSNVISDSNQMQNSYSQCDINNSQAQPQLIQQQQYPQQLITSLQTQLPYSKQSVHGHLTNRQRRNDLRNAETIVTSEATEVIDTPLPPSISVPPTVQKTSISPSVGWELTRIPERIWRNDTNSAYQIQKTILQGRMIHCINANPYVYSDVLITLEDLVKIVIPSWTVVRCALIFQKYLKITLFCGNSEQLGVLWKKGLISSINPEDTPMAMLKDVINWLNTGDGFL